MLTQSHTTTILPVVNVERARHFYEDALGLGPAETRADGSVLYRVDRGEIALSPRTEPTRNQYTAVSFEVKDVAAEVKDLERRGVAFEDYDLPELKTVEHVAVVGSEKCAWFRDPEGNILCLHQDAQSSH